MSYFVLSLLSIFLKTKTNAVTNLNPINSDNNFFSLFLIVDSGSLSCSSGLKEFTLQVLAKPCYFYLFRSKNVHYVKEQLDFYLFLLVRH